jgi:hypothetical protein
MLGINDLGWPEFLSLLECHRVERLIDVRALAVSRFGRFSYDALTRGFGDMYEAWPNLCEFESFAAPAVRRDMKKLLDTSNGARLCFIDGFHLVWLARDIGWHVFGIESHRRLVEDLGVKAVHRGKVLN